MPQIENEEQLIDWLKTQDWQVCTAIAARAQLRSLPIAMDTLQQDPNDTQSQIFFLTGLRAVLTDAEISVTSTFKHSGSFSIHELPDEIATDEFVIGIIETLARCPSPGSVLKDVTKVRESAWGEEAPLKLFMHPVWHDSPDADAFRDIWSAFDTKFAANSLWSFWCDWYRGMLAGQPMDWALQRKIALIEEEIWNNGPEAVAAEIDKIKAKFATQRPQEPRFPAYEPNDLQSLIQNRIIATASLQGLAVQISGAIEQYHADTGANALPEAFAPLQDMPALMNAIAQTLGDIQQPEGVSSETEQALRAEIGRLNAKVSDLEGKLSALSAEIEILSRSEKGKVFSLLRNTALLGGLISGLWAMSGDELGARARYENIIAYTDDIRALLIREGLPQTQVETSLRPRTRPDKGK